MDRTRFSNVTDAQLINRLRANNKRLNELGEQLRVIDSERHALTGANHEIRNEQAERMFDRNEEEN